MAGYIKQIFYRIRNTRQRWQRFTAQALPVKLFSLAQHALPGDRRPGVERRVMLLNRRQRMAGNLSGPDFTLLQRTLQRCDR